jgi:hypothetical protein
VRQKKLANKQSAKSREPGFSLWKVGLLMALSVIPFIVFGIVCGEFLDDLADRVQGTTVLLTTVTFCFILILGSWSARGVDEFVKRHGLDRPEPYDTLMLIAVLFLPGNQREAARGDIEEIFNKDAKAHGRAAARLLMALDILRSLLPKTLYISGQVAIRAAKIIGLFALIRRMIG